MITFLAGNAWWMLGLAAMALAIVSLPTFVKFRWPIAVLAFAMWGGLQWLHADQLRDTLATQETKAAKAALAYTNTVRAAEQAHAANLADIAAKAAQEQADAHREIEDLRDRLRRGDLQLRKRFTCPRAAAGAAGGADAGGAAGEEGTGLVAADAEFLVRIAAEGDDAIRERNLCIAVANEYRSLLRSLEAQR
jgi:hypothetical protein